MFVGSVMFDVFGSGSVGWVSSGCLFVREGSGSWVGCIDFYFNCFLGFGNEFVCEFFLA